MSSSPLLLFLLYSIPNTKKVVIKAFNLIKIIKTGIPIIGDGPGESIIRGYGFSENQPTILANLKQPQFVIRMHQAYLRSGSQLIKTNSLIPKRDKWHPETNRIEALCNASVALAKEASKRKAIIAACITRAPFSSPVSSRTQFYGEQAIYMSDTHADLLWLNDFEGIEELLLALKSIKHASSVQTVAHLNLGPENQVHLMINDLKRLLNAGATFLGISINAEIKMVESFIPPAIDEFGVLSVILNHRTCI